MLVASAGYLGAMTYGAILLVLIRKAVAARIVLLGSAFIILILATVFGLINPLLAGAWGSLSGIPFTFFAGLALAIGLVLVARFASARVAAFVISLLAVQCVLNALLDLKTVFFLSSPFTTTVPTDALNMANATGIPAIFWVVVWIALSVLILAVAVRQYVSSRTRAFDAAAGLSLDRTADMWTAPALPSAADRARYDKTA